MMFVDLAGSKFGRLTVLEYAGKNQRNQSLWLCECECGTIKEYLGYNLSNGHTVSCGCYCKEMTRTAKRTHGMSKTRIYDIWAHMKSRCGKPNCKEYEWYGGRGIKVCEEWANDFMAFFNWAMANGYRDDLTIERKDVAGNYDPENCEWATTDVQSNNKTTTKYLTYEGYTFSLRDWSRILGLDLRGLWWRLFTAKWDKDDAIRRKNNSNEKWRKEEITAKCLEFQYLLEEDGRRRA